MATSEIDGVHGIPIDTTSLANYLKQVLHGVGGRRNGNIVKYKSSQRYAHRFFEQANNEEGKEEKQKTQDRHDTSFRPHPQEVKAKRYRDQQDDV